MDRVVGADEEIRTCGRQTAGRAEHEIGNAPQVIGLQAANVLSE